jgi:serine/threonine protein kinase
MGEVYRAHDAKLDRAVALKVLPSGVTRDADRLRRFVQEARSASSLSHPNIVTIHDIGEAVPVEGEQPSAADAAPVNYIAMELVEGRTLRQLFDDRSIAPRTLLSYLAQAAEGLAKAHAAGIVHRDLKPENIMVSRDGYAKVLDFGLAKLTESALSGGALTETSTAIKEHATKAGAVVGTVGYMSPEQAMGKPVDHRTDLFAFGCLLYEAATGRRPFIGESSVDVLHAIVRKSPTPVEEIAPAIPRALVRTIRRCLAKEPDRRYQSMRDLALELHEMVDEWETLALPSGTVSSTSASSGSGPLGIAPPRSRRVWVVAAAAAVLLLAAAAGWLLRSGGGGSGRVESIAVLPILDISGADELFVEALYDQLIGSVGRIENLSVVSRSAVQPFATNPNVREVSAALGVDGVLEGSVFRAGEVMRINVQLTEPKSLRHLWSQSYEQEVSDVLAAQDAIVAKITGDLEAGLARPAKGAPDAAGGNGESR